MWSLFGAAGPVGQFAILSSFQRGAARVIAIDHREDRLERARAQGAETINFDEVDPVEALLELTGGRGPNRAIDAVRVDSESARSGPAEPDRAQRKNDEAERSVVAPKTNPKGKSWKPGGSSSQASRWAVESLAKAGTLGIIGVYPPTDTFFPLGTAMNRNLTINMGNGNHPRYIRELLSKVVAGLVDPSKMVTQHEPLTDIMTAYREIDLRSPGWLKVAINAKS